MESTAVPPLSLGTSNLGESKGEDVVGFNLQPAGAEAGLPAAEDAFITEPKDIESVDALKNTVAGTTEANQATLLLKKRKDMRMVEDALEAVKKDFKLRMEELADRQLKFEEKQRALQEMVAKFKPFIEENDGKRARATAKAASEVAARQRLEVEIERMIEELAAARSEKDGIEFTIQQLKRYAKYLEEVVTAAAQGTVGVAEAFESAGDILARYKTLKTTNTDLHKQATTAADELESLRNEVAALDKRIRDMALVASSGTQELRARLERTRAEVSDLTSQREFAEAGARRVRAVAGQTETSIKNIFSRILATAPANSLPHLVLDKVAPDGNYRYLEGALGIIGDRLEDLDAIVREYPAWKEQVAKEREAAAKMRAVAAGSGVAAVRAAGSHSQSQILDTSSSMAPLMHGSVASFGKKMHSSAMGAGAGAMTSVSSSVDKLGSSTMGWEGGTAAPSTMPGVYVVRVALPSISSAGIGQSVKASHSTHASGVSSRPKLPRR